MSFNTYVTISHKELKQKDACDDGLELFESIVPRGTWEGEWTILHSLMIAANSKFLGWLEGRQVVPCALVGADLCYANLRGANLCYANLSGADLRGADLSDANLSGATLPEGFKAP